MKFILSKFNRSLHSAAHRANSTELCSEVSRPLGVNGTVVRTHHKNVWLSFLQNYESPGLWKPACVLIPVFLLMTMLVPASMIQAQDRSAQPFAAPQFEKVGTSERTQFRSQFQNTQWSGAGFANPVVIDHIPTREIRARLQKAFGNPTQSLEHLINRENFRPGHFIQFEYWFVIDDEIPLMILDIDGPFGTGLVFSGSNRYIDLMPEIKRELSAILMGVEELGEYEDHYYDIDERQWYLVRYADGTFTNEKIDRPQW